jgi:hypothetical protein
VSLLRVIPPVALAAAAALLLAGCTGATPQASTPTPTATATEAAAPETLEELAAAVVEEGLVDTAAFTEITGDPGALAVQLSWTGSPRPTQQLDALAEIDARITDVFPDRPEVTQLILHTTHDDDSVSGIQTAYDPGAVVVLAMLETVTGSLCDTATLDTRDVGEGPRAIVNLRCKVDAPDAVGLAAAYDELTGIRVEAPGVDGTRWEASLTDRPTTDGDLRLEAGPIEGRQQLLVEIATLAVDGGADRLTFIDGGEGITVVGFADAAQADLCTAMNDRLLAGGVPYSSVSLQLRDVEPGAWACRITP